MSKGKNISIPTSVEAQIRSRARNLPIYQCYVNKNWKDTQLATIMVIRKHTNGNVTFGNFLVDLHLLGVKDCSYRFNQSPLRVDEILKGCEGMMEECDYHLVHNIIYAGLAFAEDFGFTPHKNFQTAQYIIEEDSDDIQEIDVPLGKNGIPTLIVPFDETGQRELSILRKTAGADYEVIFLDENGKPELEEQTYMEIFEDVIETGIEEYMEKHPNDPDDPNLARTEQVITDLIYRYRVNTKEEREQIDLAFDHITKDPRLSKKIPESVNDYSEELVLSIKYFTEKKTDKASAEVRKVIDRHPEDPYLWDIFLYNLSVDSNIVDEKIVKEAFSLFPDHPTIKAWYAEWLAQEEQTDEIFTLFGNHPGLDALTTENEGLVINAFISFCFAYAMAWLQKEDILNAEPYYMLISRLGYNQRMGEYIQQLMTVLKKKKLKELYDAGMFNVEE